MSVPGRKRDARLVTQKPDGLPEGFSLKFLNEPEDVSAGLTSEAVKKLFCRIDMKRGCLLLMKRAKSQIILAAPFKRDAVADYPDDITCLPDLLPPFSVINRFQLSRFSLPVWP